MEDFPSSSTSPPITISIPNEFLFVISTEDPWYGGILLYLHTPKFGPHLSHEDRHCIQYQVVGYLIIGDVLYHYCIDTILCHFLNHYEVEKVLNDCHNGSYGVHLSVLATT